MNKCKIIKRKGMRKLLVKGVKGQQLSEWETNTINTGDVTGLLHVDAYKKGATYNLEFDITGYLTFEEFLQVPLSRDTFARVLDNILENLKSVVEKHFNQQLILFEMDKIFINPSTQRLFFAYIPLQPFEGCGSLQEMLLNIIQYGQFCENEDSEYVSEYITILNSGINFSVFDLEQYVNKLIGGDEGVRMIQCPKCHTMIPEESILCKCGFKLHGYTGSTSTKASQVYDMFQGDVYKEEDPYTKKNNYPETPKSDDVPPARVNTVVSNPEPEVKKPKKKATTVLSLYDEEEKVYAYLVRIATEEKILIDTSPFRIGRESGNYILENRFVSDPHLDIRNRNGRYFATDLGSTNKSYIDGTQLSAQVESELFPGCCLKLANEKFQFFIE